MQLHEDGTNFGLSSLFFFQLIYEQLSGSSNIFTADLTKGYLDTRKLHNHFDHHENARKPRCLEASNRKCCIFFTYSFAVI